MPLALDEHRARCASAPAMRRRSGRARRTSARGTRLRQAAERLGEQSADRVDVVVVELDAEQVAELVEASRALTR